MLGSGQLGAEVSILLDTRYVGQTKLYYDRVAARWPNEKFTIKAILCLFIITMAYSPVYSGSLAVLSLLCSMVNSALVSVPDFGSNPTNIQMNIYVPANLATRPAVILAVRPP